MEQGLAALGSRSTLPTQQLVRQLEDRCRRAEESGLGTLGECSRTLRRYDLPLGEMR